jgi:uncharacterized protein (TIGR02594 family)
MTLPELSWIAFARQYIGQREIKGAKHNPWIVGLWPALGITWFNDDETPWCAGFANRMLQLAGLPTIKPGLAARALAFKEYGVKLNAPAYGAIAVKERQGGGHVGFVVGVDQYGNLMILGGNQGDSVKISPFKREDFVAFRWPSIYPNAERFKLPLLTSDGKPVTEA